MIDVLYGVLIFPIQYILTAIFQNIYVTINSYGFAIVALSVTVNLILIPFNQVINAFMMEERAIRQKIDPKLNEIKQAFKGEERFMMTRMLFKLNNYNHFFALRNSFGLLIQIPFLIAVYSVFVEPNFREIQFLMLRDIGKPDALLKIWGHSFNLLPILMTSITILSGHIYSKHHGIKSSYQIYFLPIIFLIILYAMPATVLIYWTTNCFLSLIKNISIKFFSPAHADSNAYKEIVARYKGFIEGSFIIFGAMIIACLLVPAFVISNNLVDFQFIDSNVFLQTSLLFTTALTVVLIFISFFLHFFKGGSVAKFLTYFGLSYVIYAGFLFPIPDSSILKIPEDMTLNLRNFVAVIALAGITSTMAFFNFWRYFRLFLTIIVTVSVATTLFNYIEIQKFSELLESKRSDNYISNVLLDPGMELSQKKNVLVVSLDGLPSSTVVDLIENDVYLQNSFKDFSFFKNAVNEFPSTKLSLISDIHGTRDFKLNARNFKLLQSYIGKLNESAAHTNFEDRYQYGYNLSNIPQISTLAQSNLNYNGGATFDAFQYFFVRMLPPQLFEFVPWQKISAFKNFLSSGVNRPSQALVEPLQQIKNNPHIWEEGIKDFVIFDRILNDLSLSKKEESLRYFHFLFTHHPVSFDKNCHYIGADIATFKIKQNEKGLSDQIYCGLNKLVELINKLKALKIYDESLIIFKTDHGQANSFFTEYPHTSSINNTEWGYNRYSSFIMVKGFGTKRKNIQWNDDVVLQSDISKTVCVNSSMKRHCAALKGRDLLSDQTEVDSPYFLYVPQNNNLGYWKYENLISVSVPNRKTTLLTVMEKLGLIEKPTDLEVPAIK